MSYKTRMIPANLNPDAIIRDLCVEGVVWELGAQNNPRILKRTDLIPIAKCWHEFIIHNILPTKNQSEITLDRAVLIHCIMQGQEVRVEKLIVDSMMKVINKLHFPKTPLALPNIIARLCDEMEKEQLQKFQEEQRAKNAEMTHVMANMCLDCQSADIYTNWALQQMNQNLVPIPPARIPRMIRENFQASSPLVHGMLRTRRTEGSSSGLDQQTLPAANTPREPSADNN
ncbi:hypothetical protein PIB30_105350 [Stylosanthes scabra]|uniref:Putative plant transposon protein domain-containing protein n=1 Tax=Stylosanthes scabra TaxID=79078 RepID=A0ABU6ZX52_9FABA|nr:hypothetical protein [Stylosanthes scabra]